MAKVSHPSTGARHYKSHISISLVATLPTNLFEYLTLKLLLAFDMIKMVSVLPELQALNLDDSEMIAAIRSAENAGSMQKTKRIYEMRADSGRLIATIRLNSSNILCSIEIPNDVWKTLRDKILAGAAQNRLRVARSTLFTYRPLSGVARITDWLQLRPVASELIDSTGFQFPTQNLATGIPRPFVIEVIYRDSDLAFLGAHRRIRSVQEAAWLLCAFIDIPVFILRNPYSWVLLNNSCHLARCGMLDGLENSSDLEFSDTTGLTDLTPAPTESYFRELGVTTREFRVPDLGNLYSRYKALSPQSQLRFLRSCACLFGSSNQTVGSSEKLVSLVSAIEPLFKPTERCDKCKQHKGITKQFGKFLDQYVQPIPVIRDLYMNIYQSRSRLVHGGWNFDVDEPMLGVSQETHTLSLAAWDATKRGTINWLLSQPSIPST